MTMRASSCGAPVSAILVLTLAACAGTPRVDRPLPTRAASPGTSAPEPAPSAVAPLSLAAIVTQDANLTPAAGTSRAPLTVFRTLAGGAAYRASDVTPAIPPGLRWAMLTDFDSDDDHAGAHEDRYRSFVAAFESSAEAQAAYRAAIAHHESTVGWKFTRQIRADLGNAAVFYAIGNDYGYSELSVYLWQRGPLLLQAVDFHPYDRPHLLRSFALSMDVRAADALAGR
jgi:hypothetical protein